MRKDICKCLEDVVDRSRVGEGEGEGGIQNDFQVFVWEN